MNFQIEDSMQFQMQSVSKSEKREREKTNKCDVQLNQIRSN